MDTILTKLQVRRIGEAARKMRVVAVYEDFATCARVNESCRSVARDLDHDCELIKQAWLVNLLRLPQLRAIAAQEATSADLIIISLHDAERPPDEVKDWFELWLQEASPRPTVLLVLADMVCYEETRTADTYLEGVAKRGNMDLVVQPWQATEGRPK
jgi:hypothetical protein